MAMVGRNKCSVCRRPCAGHTGSKYGPSCTNTPLTDDEVHRIYGQGSENVQQCMESNTVTGGEQFATPSTSAPWLQVSTNLSGSTSAPTGGSAPIQSIPGTSQVQVPPVTTGVSSVGTTQATMQTETQATSGAITSTSGATTSVSTDTVHNTQVTSLVPPVQFIDMPAV